MVFDIYRVESGTEFADTGKLSVDIAERVRRHEHVPLLDILECDLKDDLK